MDGLLQRVKKQEDEVKELETQLFSRPEFKDNRKIEELRGENEKLNYRANVLVRSIEELKNQSVNSNSTDSKQDQTASTEAKSKKPANNANAVPPKPHFTVGAEGDDQHAARILDILINLFEQAIRKAFPEDSTLPVLVVPGKQTDYQCNSAMTIAQKLSASGTKQVPTDIAKKIVENLPQHQILDKVGFSGPGFINITISPAFVSAQIRNILNKGVLPPNVINIVETKSGPNGNKRPRVVVDLSSPNIAKEMHVGHLRSTIIGDTIARLLEYTGFDVLRLNHLGDWGTQFGMLIAHLQDMYPEYKTKSPPIGELMQFYKASKKRFDAEPEFKKRAYELVGKLQSYDPDITHAWELICDASRKDFQYIYKEIDVKLIDRGESFYQSRMLGMIKELEEKNLLITEEGRQVMFIPGISVPMTVVKSGGGFTYDTSDMATIKHRLQEEHADWLVYVIDIGQGLHLQSVFAGAKIAGWAEGRNVRIDHVGFGVVLGEDGKRLKSRSGETVRLRDLLDEGLERSKKKLQEKGRDKVLTPEEFAKAQKSVAYGCIKYADLSHSRTSDYIFSFDRMLDDRGNTAAYLLYAYTRIRSIARTANIDPETLKNLLPNTELNFEIEERELKLAKTILKYSDVFTRILEDLYIHPLCEYMYQLATAFTDFYDRCYCVEKDKVTGEIRQIHYRRIFLCEATANVMKQCFELLGIEPLERM